MQTRYPQPADAAIENRHLRPLKTDAYACSNGSSCQNDVMTQDEAIDLIADNLPYQAAAELIECMQPSIRIHTSRCEKDSKSISKFGGDAYLPPQTPWPQWDPSASLRGQMERLQTLFGGRPDFLESKTGKPFQEEIRRLEEEIARGRAPLTFLGQIVLSDLPSVSAVGLPERGVLLFFYDVKSSPWGFDPRDGGSAQVLYLPDESVHRELRSKPDSIASIEIAPTALRFTQEWTIPDGLGQNDQDSLAGEPSKKVAYEQFLRELYGEEETVHRIRGYPQPIQGDMHLQIQLVT